MNPYPKWRDVRERYFARKELEVLDEEVRAEIEQIKRLELQRFGGLAGEAGKTRY
ncbi:MAG TPA: hypothetical protein PLU72_15025 [Candidatus Ozemobacteraceae bacterium]|nr:hypothetical protein [Candidatus Ozemobacteraceae bacterium]